MISPAAVIGEKVMHGKGCRFDDFVVVGRQTSDGAEPMPATRMGNDCIIRSHSVIYANNVIGDCFTTGHHAVVRDNNRISNNVSLGSLSIIEHSVTIGDGVRIHSQAFIPEYCELSRGAWIGPGARLTNVKYPHSKGAKSNIIGVFVGENAVIGANAVILPGVRIGVRAVVGAGAVVTKDVPAGTIVRGNPATVTGGVDDLLPQPGQEERPYS